MSNKGLCWCNKAAFAFIITRAYIYFLERLMLTIPLFICNQLLIMLKTSYKGIHRVRSNNHRLHVAFSNCMSWCCRWLVGDIAAASPAHIQHVLSAGCRSSITVYTRCHHASIMNGDFVNENNLLCSIGILHHELADRRWHVRYAGRAYYLQPNLLGGGIFSLLPLRLKNVITDVLFIGLWAT